MSEWPMVKLGDLGEFINGFAFKPSDWSEDGTPIIRIQNLTNPQALFNRTTKRVKDVLYVEPGDLLVSWSATLGVFRWQGKERAVLNQHIFKVVSKPIIENEFLEFSLKFALQQVEKYLHGATMRHVNRQEFLDLKIPLPPLGEQKRIAEILGGVSKAIKDAENIIHNVQGLKRSVLRDILNNKSGEYVQLSQISSVQSGITKGRKVQNGITLMPTPYMAVSNVKAGYLDLSGVKQIDASEAEVNRYQLQAGDILLTEGGDPDKLGRGTIWRNEIPGAIHQNHIFRVRINPDSGFTSEALMAILESTESKEYFLRSAKQTTGISSINKRQLSATPIPVLGKVQVEELTNMWHKIDEVIELYHRKLSLLQELQKSLATRAFAGLL